MATSQPNKRAFEPSPIPDRLYFKIGDVARICGVEPYVLRFWETQFSQLRPNKSGTGQRLYRRRDVELALEIKRLVHGEGYTIPGARQAMAHTSARPAETPETTEAMAALAPAAETLPATLSAAMTEIRNELREIAMLLSGSEATPFNGTQTSPLDTPEPVVLPEAETAPARHQPRRRMRHLPAESFEIGSLFPV